MSKGEGAGVLPALFKQHNIEVLEQLTYRTKDTDYSAQVTKAKSLGAEGIGLGSCYQNAAAIAKEMAKQGLNVPIVGGACAGAPGFIEIAGKAAEGAYMSTAAWIDDPRPEVQAYVKKIVAKLNGAAAALQRSARLRHHLLLQALHREVGRHQQAVRHRQRSRQDPRLPRRPEGLSRRRGRDHHGRGARRRRLERDPEGGQRQIRQHGEAGDQLTRYASRRNGALQGAVSFGLERTAAPAIADRMRTRTLALATLLATPAQAASLDGAAMGWPWALPFAGLLLTIAAGPLLFPKIWHAHYGKIAAAWAALALAPLAVVYGAAVAAAALVHALLGEYPELHRAAVRALHRRGRHSRHRQPARHAAGQHRDCSRSAPASPASSAPPAPP